MFKLLRRNKSSMSSEIKASLAYGAMMGDSHRPLTETEMMDQLGINIHMLEDDKLNSFLETLSLIKDQEGKVIDIDLNAVALRIENTKLIRGSWVDPIDVDINQLDLEAQMDRMEMDMDEDTYESGGTNVLEGFAKVIQTAWSDAKGGRKLKVLKVASKIYEIATTESKKKESVIP